MDDFLFDLENPLTTSKEHQSDIVASLFSDESGFLLHSFPANFRSEALLLISKYCENVDPFVSYLAVNYMDRFISSKKFVNQEKPWMVGLVAISCVSLAIKMKNCDFHIPNLQGYECPIYDAKSINRMEVLILARLNWRMRSITPFAFLNYFISLFEFKDTCLSQAVKDRASQIILKSPYEFKLLEFKPSVIAASALFYASEDLITHQRSHFKAAITSCKYLNKESLDECFGIIQEITSDSNESISVLDYQCTSSESENSTSIKRRKLSGALSFSQVQNH